MDPPRANEAPDRNTELILEQALAMAGARKRQLDALLTANLLGSQSNGSLFLRPSMMNNPMSAAAPLAPALNNRPAAKKQRTEMTDKKEAGVAQISNTTGEVDVRFRDYQSEIWIEKFNDLVSFKGKHGHCHVPHKYEENPALAQWVKRQRYQYKLKLEGKRSTLTDDRIQMLQQMNFVWSSHDAVWAERFMELCNYKRIHGNCLVPSSYQANQQLAIWVKRQRRQYKFYKDGKATSMTADRIERLNTIGFEWDCRKPKTNQTAGKSQTTKTTIPSSISNVIEKQSATPSPPASTPGETPSSPRREEEEVARIMINARHASSLPQVVSSNSVPASATGPGNNAESALLAELLQQQRQQQQQQQQLFNGSNLEAMRQKLLLQLQESMLRGSTSFPEQGSRRLGTTTSSLMAAQQQGQQHQPSIAALLLGNTSNPSPLQEYLMKQKR